MQEEEGLWPWQQGQRHQGEPGIDSQDKMTSDNISKFEIQVTCLAFCFFSNKFFLLVLRL